MPKNEKGNNENKNLPEDGDLLKEETNTHTNKTAKTQDDIYVEMFVGGKRGCAK